MKAPLRIVFLGNHTLGVRTMEVIRREAQLIGVVAHPDDPEDGVNYESVFGWAQNHGLPVIRSSGKKPRLGEFIASLDPDLIWITDYRYLLPAAVIALAPRGAVNLHPSLLPRYRGRAPVNWGILRGETQFGLTAHYVDAGMDTGDIIAQRQFDLSQQEDVGTALDRLYPLYENLTQEVLRAFASGTVPRQPQDHAEATAYPRRTPADGLIDWRAPALEVWNLVRAVAAPYPGAFAPWDNACLRIWRIGGLSAFPPGRQPRPGELLAVTPTTMTVACGDAAVVITRYALEPALAMAEATPREFSLIP